MSLGKFPDFLLNFSGYEMSHRERHSYSFNSFRLDVEDRRLFDDGVPVSLEPKVFDVLALLIENSGHLVEKDELLRAVWADSFVEEANVARVIYTLRKVLGQDAGDNKFIETVAKRGYRFVAEVTRDDPHEHTNGQATLNEVADIPAALPKHKLTQSGSHAIVDLAEWREVEARADKQREPLKLVREEPEIANAEPATRQALPGSWRGLAAVFSVAVLAVAALGYYFFSRPSVTAGKRSIAVLPFKPIGSSSRNEDYEIGMADSVINRLAGVEGLIVRPLHAMRKYADIEQDPIAAGKEQQADYVLAANYQVAVGKIRITAQLYDVASGQIEETYKSDEKDTDNLFAMQDAIAFEVGNLLKTRFATTMGDSMAKRGTSNVEAYRLYLQGKNLMMKRNPADFKKSIEYFEQAIRLDPNYASAYAGLAGVSIGAEILGDNARRGAAEKAQSAEKIKATLAKALQLDPNLAEAYAVRANLDFVHDWNLDSAEKNLLRAIELEPNNDHAHWLYSLVLAYRGRFDEAMKEVETAQAIYPGALMYMRDRGRFLYYARRYDEAIEQLNRVVDLDEDFGSAYGWLVRSFELRGDYDAAYSIFIKRQQKANPDRAEIFQRAYESGGWQAVRRKQLEISKTETYKGDSYFDMARLTAVSGENEQTLEFLNKALEQRDWQIIMLAVDPMLDNLRDDPRFDELLGRVGLK